MFKWNYILRCKYEDTDDRQLENVINLWNAMSLTIYFDKKQGHILWKKKKYKTFEIITVTFKSMFKCQLMQAYADRSLNTKIEEEWNA